MSVKLIPACVKRLQLRKIAEDKMKFNMIPQHIKDLVYVEQVIADEIDKSTEFPFKVTNRWVYDKLSNRTFCLCELVKWLNEHEYDILLKWRGTENDGTLTDVIISMLSLVTNDG